MKQDHFLVLFAIIVRTTWLNIVYFTFLALYIFCLEQSKKCENPLKMVEIVCIITYTFLSKSDCPAFYWCASATCDASGARGEFCRRRGWKTDVTAARCDRPGLPGNWVSRQPRPPGPSPRRFVSVRRAIAARLPVCLLLQGALCLVQGALCLARARAGDIEAANVGWREACTARPPSAADRARLPVCLLLQGAAYALFRSIGSLVKRRHQRDGMGWPVQRRC